MKIQNIQAMQILDSRGNPTVEATMTLENGQIVTASVPSGASTGKNEALELRDGDKTKYNGLGVNKAVYNINEVIRPVILDSQVDITEDSAQIRLDNLMLSLDGTEFKTKLGANAILPVSMCITRAGAIAKDIPLYQHVAQLFGNKTESFRLPMPMFNVLNGGKHAENSTDMQEYMIVPIGAKTMAQAVEIGANVYHNLKKIIHSRGLATTVGDEGGFAPALSSNSEPFDLLTTAIIQAGYVPGKDVAFAIDPAASSFMEGVIGDTGEIINTDQPIDLSNRDQAIARKFSYDLKRDGVKMNTDQLLELYAGWIEKFPLISIEDIFAEEDWGGFIEINQRFGDRIQVMGDDLYVTNTKFLQKGIDWGASNSILIKINQIGSISETINAVKLAVSNGMTAIVSHRSGETEDSFIADFVVGAGTGQIKTGSLARSERVAKYNRLMKIELELGARGSLAEFPFKR